MSSVCSNQRTRLTTSSLVERFNYTEDNHVIFVGSNGVVKYDLFGGLVEKWTSNHEDSRYNERLRLLQVSGEHILYSYENVMYETKVK